MLDALWAKRHKAWAGTAGVVVTLALGVTLFAVNGWARKDPLRDVPVHGAEIARTVSNGADVAAPLHWGGYLAYAWMGNPRYFIDGRDHLMLFGNGAFDDSNSMWRGGPDALHLLDIYQVNVVVWERGHPFDWQLQNDRHWLRVGAGPIEVVYVRVTP